MMFVLLKLTIMMVDANIKLPKVTTEDIVQLQQAKDTPLQYIVSPDRPIVDSPFGKVQLRSILSYQLKKPLCSQIALSDIEPVNNSEIKVTDPLGSQPTSALSVVEDL
ncbi:hypothetical protein ACF0H5_006529 [Mactra antiquata]